MILRLDPGLVGDHQRAAAVEMTAAFAPATRGWITKDRGGPGPVGSPPLATAEQGETLFQVFADDVER